METRQLEILAYLQGYMDCQLQTMGEEDAFDSAKVATILKYYELPIFKTALDKVLEDLK
jgi:hypothetical protein